VQHLGASGDVLTLRGPHGGLRLARPATEIQIGAIVQGTEPDMTLVPCAACVIQPACGLPSVLDKALAAFMAVLNQHTIADLVSDPRTLILLLDRSGEFEVQRL
jgi:Rrf2 family nitric oxide-sensitive transcriptional repressor